MSLGNMSKEELEVLSYTDLTYMLLKENKESMNTASIFKKICELLDYSDEDFANKIGDYYTSLNIDKRFVLLDNHEWDLREHHSVDVVVDEDDDDEIDEEFDVLEDNEEEELEEDIETAVDDEDLDDEDDDLDDLALVSEEDEEEEI